MNLLQVDTITFAGHDTTAASIYYTLYMLSLHPNFMARVEDEIQNIFGDDRERPATMEDLSSLKYLECFIKETMRLYPSVTFISRECNEDVMIEVQLALHMYGAFASKILSIHHILFQNHVIPAKTEIVLFIHGQHRNPEDFPNPEIFDPDRFLPEEAAKRSAYAYVPFSAGRCCCDIL